MDAQPTAIAAESTGALLSISPKISVRFWGVRGSIASPGPHTVRYGANTSCVEIRCGEHLLICDAGTGLRPLGLALSSADQMIDADILCTHTHLDHICGFPFFAPCYAAGNRLRVWGGHATAQGDIRAAFRTAMSPPLFPEVMDSFAASVEFRDFRSGDSLSLRPDLSVQTQSLNHPGGATGYRIEWQGKVVAYITDTEHRPGTLDVGVVALARGADLMIYDAHYTDQDYGAHVGFGHSTWQEAVKVATQAAAGTLALFHHDPARTDAMLDDIATAAQRARPGTIVAREGLVCKF